MGIYEKLYPWQKNIIDTYAKRKKLGLFLDMGLGKTPLALAFAERHDAEKIFIIAPNSKVTEKGDADGSWLFWARRMRASYRENVKTFTPASGNDIYLVNYEYLYDRKTEKIRRTVCDFINSCEDKNICLILDESHKIKTLGSRNGSKQAKCIERIYDSLRVLGRNIHVYLLTGTPFTTGYIDLYAQLRFLGYEQTKTAFCERFCIRGNIRGLLGWQQPIVGYKNLDELFEIVHRFAITIKSKEVIDLPEMIEIPCKMPESEHFKMFMKKTVPEKALQKYCSKRDITLNMPRENTNNPFYMDIDFNGERNGRWIADTPIGTYLRARQLSIGFQGNEETSEWYDRSRLDFLADFLKDHPNNYLIFYNFTPEFFEIYDICEKLEYNIDVYNGIVKSLHFYDKFAAEENTNAAEASRNVIIANFASGSVGMNWQKYNHCIIFSIPQYKDYVQGVKRIHRTGQKNTTFYYIFESANWLDRKMMQALRNRQDYDIKLFTKDFEKETK